MAKKEFLPNFRTPKEEQAGVENIKRNSLFVQREVAIQFREDHIKDVSNDVEQYAKSFGIYLELDRDVKGRDFQWYYMIRIANPGGGPISREQWRLYDDLSEKHTHAPDGKPSLRFTTRQTVQFHWLNKAGVRDIVKTLAEADMRSINGCGDNTRNVMACPLSRNSDIFDTLALSKKIADYFQLPLEPYMKVFGIDPNKVRQPEESFKYGPNLLNRKFKIGITSLHRDPNSGIIVPDNCVEMRTHDLGISPIIENEKVIAYQLYVGGGQGERNGFPTTAAFSEPLGIVTEEHLKSTLDNIVATHQEWGDRENRHWARLKYVIKKQGIDWFRDQVTARSGVPLQKSNPDHDYGDRQLHHGWIKQRDNKWTFGAYIENGRLTDGGPNGDLKKMVRTIMDKYDTELLVTPNQDALFTNIDEAQKDEFENDLRSHGWGKRNGVEYSSLRRESGACVGLNSCRLSYTDSEKLEPILIDELEKRGWGDVNESIGITGCERQCFRPATKSIGLVGTGKGLYTFKLFGDVTARYQGKPLIDSTGEKMYLRFVKKDTLVDVIDAIFQDHKANKKNNESLGAYHRRIGADSLIKQLQEHPTTAAIMQKPFNTDFVLT